MKRLLLIATTSLICIPQSALAENYGAYLGAGFASVGLYSICAIGYIGSCNKPSSPPKEGANFRLIGGYDFNKHFGVEAGYSELGSYNVQNPSGSTVGELKASAYTLALKGGNTFSNGFSIFGKLGLASVKTRYTTQPSWTLLGSANQKSSGLLAGVVSQYNINENFGLRLSFEMIDYADSEFQNYASGVTFMAMFKL